MRALTVCALIAGAAIRIAILPIGAPAVDDSWRAWSYHAATRGPWNLYGPRGHTVTFGDIVAPVVYPPLALDELAIVGRAHMAINGGRFENDVALTRSIKGAIVLLDAVLAALIFFAVRRAANTTSAWGAALAYWLNPAVLMCTTLGYVDVFLAIPAIGTVVAASYGRPWLTGALFSAAVLTKPQGLFVAPAAALALWNAGASATASRRLQTAIAASALTAAIIAAPVVMAGRGYYMLRSIAVLAGHNMLSALAFNLWWIVSYVFAAVGNRAAGLRAALTARPEIVTHAEAMARGLPNPRLLAAVLLLAVGLSALNTARRARDLGLQTALAAFLVVTYFTLSVQVHENHFFLAVPLLAIAAALRPALAPVFAALSVVFALNLYVLFGLRGEGPPSFVPALAGVDSGVLLACVECAVFGWFAAVFARACAQVTASSCGAASPAAGAP